MVLKDQVLRRFIGLMSVVVGISCAGLIVLALLGGRFVPEGWQVLYVRQADFYYRALWRVDTSRGLTFPENDVRYAESVFALSPDGRFLLATRYDESSAQTRIFDLHSGLRSESIVGSDQWAWSPDGRFLAFVDEQGDLFKLSRPDFDKGETTFRLTDATLLVRSRGDMSAPVWSPDGTRIAYQDFRANVQQIYVVSADGSENFALIGADDREDRLSSASDPAWSPDGAQIAFVYELDGNPEIYVVEVETGNLTRITHHPSNDVAPLWSPDGSQLVFLSDRRYLLGELILADLTEPLRFVPLDVTAFLASSPQWSPDGRRLVYISGDDGEIERVDVETGRVHQLTNEQMSHRLP